MRRTLTLLTTVLVFGLACDSGDTAGDETPESESGDPSGELSFRTDVEPILLASCSCHTAAMPASGLDLSEGNGFGALVGTAATQAGMSFVEAGDPQNSYMLHKLDGTQADVGGAGAQMPMGGALADDQITTIEDWIEAGAAP